MMRNLALSSHARKGEFTKIASGESITQDGKNKKDMSKFK
jgi:hypothetical protein